jgi:hypothetical protein
MPHLFENWLGVVLILVWIGVGAQWLVNGRRYARLLDMMEDHGRMKMELDHQMLGAIRAKVAEANDAAARH